MIGQKIKLRREQLGMSQKELAEKTQMKQPNISAIECGKVPTLKVLRRICLVLGLEVGEVI